MEGFKKIITPQTRGKKLQLLSMSSLILRMFRQVLSRVTVELLHVLVRQDLRQFHKTWSHCPDNFQPIPGNLFLFPKCNFVFSINFPISAPRDILISIKDNYEHTQVIFFCPIEPKVGGIMTCDKSCRSNAYYRKFIVFIFPYHLQNPFKTKIPGSSRKKEVYRRQCL